MLSFVIYVCNTRLKSKRIYKTLLRSHHKHSSSESQRTESSPSTNCGGIDVTDHPESAIQLQRSSSTPNLKRCWLCQSCNVLNNSVTWHCLNCECVSVVAPIYKDTIQKGCIRANVGFANATAAAAAPKSTTTSANAVTATAAATTTAASAITDIDNNTVHATNNFNHKIVKCKSKSLVCVDGSKSIVALDLMNPATAPHIVDFDHRRMHRYHSHRSMDVCPVLIAAQSTPGDCYVNQIKFNEVTRFQPVAGLCPLNRHLENKSLPNIVDAFHDYDGSNLKILSNDQQSATTPSMLSENFFGERIFTVNKPQPFLSIDSATATLGKPTATVYGSIRNSARNKAITPIHEIQKFTRYATKSAVRESSAVKKMCTPGEACRMCNMGRCSGGGGGGAGSGGGNDSNSSFSIVHNNTKNQMLENPLDTSRFTVTTLSRSNNALIKSKDRNQTTQSRNVGGGVLIAVRDWSAQEKCGGMSAKNGISPGSSHYGGNAVIPLSSPSSSQSAAAAANTSSDSYYEILRNPNNNAAGITSIIASESSKELLNNRMVKAQAQAQAQAHIYENSSLGSGKIGDSNGPIYAVVNKMNKTKNVKALGGAVEGLKSPEQTRFTYIGMSKPIKSMATTAATNATSATQPAMDSDAIFTSGKNSSSTNNNNNNSSSSHIGNNNNGALTNNVMMPSLNNVNNNNNNNNNGVSSSSSSDCSTPIVATNADFSTKVWKGQKKPIETNKM